MNQLTEFLTNPEFVRWVKNPDEELDLYWSNWIKANPSRINDIKLAREIVSGIGFHLKSPSQEIKDEVLNNILSDKVRGQNGDLLFNSPKDDIIHSYLSWFQYKQIYRVASIIILVFGLSFIFHSLWNWSNKAPVEQVVAMLEKSTKQGERLNCKLPDGTIVQLNSNSSIRYPEDFKGESRPVELNGEAFFEVAHNPLKPFRVTSSDLVTTALGTSFNINNKNDVISVALVTGKVEVKNLADKGRNLLKPGQELIYSAESRKTNIGEFNMNSVLAWRDGILVFSENNFEEVIEGLENWYGVSINYEGNPKREWNLSIQFDNASLERVLSRIAYIEKFNYEMNDKTITIKF
ncbi:FecR family protein [Echinicola salinicaeni]|uniref:FecR family protein n=1 Tax=Echinicola salinicaeni TaxID=2762757 RepID=UPI0016455C2B|nr:FecR family protein [Echinicola salinicaeni]